MADHSPNLKKFSMILGVVLLGAGVLILVIYAITYLLASAFYDKQIMMPCNLEVTISTLISFGIAFVWKLSEEKT